MKIIDCPQGGSQWVEVRLGKITASRVKDMMTKGRKKDENFGQTALSYMRELVAETLTGESVSIDTPATRHGTEYEPDARAKYEAKTGVKVQEVGFGIHDKFPSVGMSPDGLVGDDGMIEIKCPFTSKNHVEYFLLDGCPDIYFPQVQFQLWVAGRDWCDFISYDPRMPEKTQLSIKRVTPDKELHAKFAERCDLFCTEMALMLEKMGMI
jgi:putative phage-type endonuclease